MAVSSATAARHACFQTGWNLTQLSLQKILYIAHMSFYGRSGQHLIAQPFEAWDFGPVEPNLYHLVSQFGANRINRDVFGFQQIANEEMRQHLTNVVDQLKSWSPSQLVQYTHAPNSAWWHTYDPSVRSLIIPDHLILEEYNFRNSSA